MPRLRRYRVERVVGSNVAQWAEATSSVEQPHTLEVTLKQRTLGAYTLTVDLARPVSELPKTLAVAGVLPLDTQKLTGTASVSAEEGAQVKTESFNGLTEMPAGGHYDLARTPHLVNGYNIVHWTENAVSYWAISDLAAAKLEDFARLFRATPAEL